MTRLTSTAVIIDILGGAVQTNSGEEIFFTSSGAYAPWLLDDLGIKYSGLDDSVTLYLILEMEKYFIAK